MMDEAAKEPIAILADQLGLTVEQVRSEIEASVEEIEAEARAERASD